MIVIDIDLSRKLRNMTFLLACLIVVFHLPCGLNTETVSSRIVGFIKQEICPIAVPCFFAVSGFFLGRQCDEAGWYHNVMRKKLSSLVVPYFAVNTLYLPFIYVYHNVLRLGEWPGNGMGFDFYTIGRIYGLNPFSMPACNAFWFIRSLWFFFLVSPLVVWVIRRSKTMAILLVFVITILIHIQETCITDQKWLYFFYDFFCMRGFLFFVGGLFLSRHRLFRCGWKWTVVLCSALVLVCWVAEMIESDSVLRVVTSILKLVLMSSVFYCFVPCGKWYEWLTKSSFAIFAFHQLLFVGYGFLVRGLGWRAFNWPLVDVTIPLLLGVGGPVFISVIIKRCGRSLSLVFLGGR